MFSRLYLETSELVAAGWPRLSADLENVFKFTAAGKISVFLPAPVELELQHRWQRDLEEKTAAMRSKVQAVQAHFAGVEKISISAGSPHPGDALDSYLRAVAELKHKYGLSTVEFTRRSVNEIFIMATTRHPPFKEGKEDVGFRDAVIFLSVVDDLLAAKGRVGALVARDGAFHDPRVIEFAAGVGVELQVFTSVAAVFDALIADAVDYVKKQWDATIAQVQQSLESRLAEIEKFITEALDPPEWGLLSGAQVVAVPRIEALGVRDVRTPNPLDARKAERIRFSFDVQVRFHVEVARPQWPQARRVKIGRQQTLAELLGSLGSAELSEPQPEQPRILGQPTQETEVVRTVLVEASSDPNYQSFTFESAALVPEADFGGLARLALGR